MEFVFWIIAGALAIFTAGMVIGVIFAAALKGDIKDALDEVKKGKDEITSLWLKVNALENKVIASAQEIKKAL